MRVGIYKLICIIIFALPLAATGKTVALSSKSGDLEINGTLLDLTAAIIPLKVNTATLF